MAEGPKAEDPVPLNAPLSNTQGVCLNFKNGDSLVLKVCFVFCNYPAKLYYIGFQLH
jgi:hypothetical protein